MAVSADSRFVKAAPVKRALRTLADPAIAEHSQRFFKTGPGEYGEGDLFLGVRVPALRNLSKRCLGITRPELVKLVSSRYHEERLLALLVLVAQFSRAGSSEQAELYRFYIEHRAHANNWDLVDSSASYIVGAYLLDRPRDLLHELAISPSLWDRRIAIIATHHFIRTGDFTDTLELARVLLHDREDLIHKAAGWMLREVGKRDRDAEETFLRGCYADMPRTMLRYAIEKFPEARRKAYLQGTV